MADTRPPKKFVQKFSLFFYMSDGKPATCFLNLPVSFSQIFLLISLATVHVSSLFHPARTILPTMQTLVPTSSIRYFILLLSIILTPAILLIQLFSYTCSLCCCLDIITVSKSYVLAGTSQEISTFHFSFLEFFLSMHDYTICYGSLSRYKNLPALSHPFHTISTHVFIPMPSIFSKLT